jgi:hypothetical protein
MFQTHLYPMQMVGQSETKFDVRKFNWLGSWEKGQMMLYVRAVASYKSIDDIIKKPRSRRNAAARGLRIRRRY